MYLRFYSRPTSPNRTTVVGSFHENGDLEVAVARCSKKDSFIKRKGAKIAEGRLAGGKSVTIPKEVYMNLAEEDPTVETHPGSVRAFCLVARPIADVVQKNGIDSIPAAIIEYSQKMGFK